LARSHWEHIQAQKQTGWRSLNNLLTVAARRFRASVIATIGNAMSYTLAAAAAACGVNKVHHLESDPGGEGFRAAKDEHGEWHVEPAELHRVYPPASERTGAAYAGQRDAWARAPQSA
jgi:hypothetical protein